MHTTFYYLREFLDKLAKDQCSSLLKTVSTTSNMCIQPLLWECIDLIIACGMDVSVIFDICTYCFCILYNRCLCIITYCFSYSLSKLFCLPRIFSHLSVCNEPYSHILIAFQQNGNSKTYYASFPPTFPSAT